MKVFTYPLIPFTIFLSLGILTNSYLNFSFEQILVLVGISIGSFFAIWLQTKNSWKSTILFGISTYLAAFSIGVSIQHFHFQPNSTQHYSHSLKNEAVFSGKGIIVANLKSTSKNTKHILSITECNSEKTTGQLLIYVKKEASKTLIPGDEIVFISECQEIPKNFNPYQFDYATYLEHQNIFHQVFLKENDYLFINHKSNWNSFWFQLQKKLTESFDIHKFDDKTQAILNSLLFGQRKLLDKETLTTYSNAGIIHILAISGLHVGILYLLLITLLKPLKHIPKGKLLSLLITLFLLWSFAVLTGLSASVTRAVTMFSVIAIGKFLNRNTNTYNTVAFSALLLLLFNPNFIFDVGFQMSYAAVLAIVAFHPFFKYFYFTKSKTARFFTDLILVSLAAQIGVLPLSLFYFNQFPMLFLLANIVVIPLTTLILWLGISTLVLNFLFPKLALLSGEILKFCISILNLYAEWISSFEKLVLRNISFSSTLCLVSYLVIFLFLFWLYKRTFQYFKYALLGIICLQICFLFTKQLSNTSNEMIFFNAKNSLISIKQNGKINFFTNEVELNSETINHYKRGSFNDSIEVYPLQNIYAYHKEQILVIDSIYYAIEEKPTILFLTNNPNINLERILTETHPQQVIADNSNPFYKIEHWKATCAKRKIPFHATAEKGFYSLK